MFFFFLKMGFLHIGQAGFELPTSGDPPALASQSAGITGVSHRAQPGVVALKYWAILTLVLEMNSVVQCLEKYGLCSKSIY